MYKHRYSRFKSITLIALFFLITPITLITSIFSLITISEKADPVPQVLAAADTLDPLPVGVNIYASLPKSFPSVDAQIREGDARYELVRQYLNRYNSPLEEHAEYIVKKADENDLDFRLVTAIAQQESNLCKFIPAGTYNCWGWGIHSRGTLGFASYEEGIEIVSEGLRREYISKGFETPKEIMSKYTPLSNGSWALGVEMFMDQMK